MLDGKYSDVVSGVPQCGIVSPLLFNIYMHEFDLFILKDIKQNINEKNLSEKRRPKVYNYAYKSISKKKENPLKKITTLLKERQYNDLDSKQQTKIKLLTGEFKEYAKKEVKLKAVDSSKKTLDFTYVRYADVPLLRSSRTGFL